MQEMTKKLKHLNSYQESDAMPSVITTGDGTITRKRTVRKQNGQSNQDLQQAKVEEDHSKDSFEIQQKCGVRSPYVVARGPQVYPSNLSNNWYQSRWFKLVTGSDEYASIAGGQNS
ncbi:hypothetical protein JHK85_056089 [Glycine max]|nr:hypothetical protein JHK85_056089 [Glycine max]